MVPVATRGTAGTPARATLGQAGADATAGPGRKGGVRIAAGGRWPACKRTRPQAACRPGAIGINPCRRCWAAATTRVQRAARGTVRPLPSAPRLHLASGIAPGRAPPSSIDDQATTWRWCTAWADDRASTWLAGGTVSPSSRPVGGDLQPPSLTVTVGVSVYGSRKVECRQGVRTGGDRATLPWRPRCSPAAAGRGTGRSGWRQGAGGCFPLVRHSHHSPLWDVPSRSWALGSSWGTTSRRWVFVP